MVDASATLSPHPLIPVLENHQQIREDSVKPNVLNKIYYIKLRQSVTIAIELIIPTNGTWENLKCISMEIVPIRLRLSVR